MNWSDVERIRSAPHNMLLRADLLALCDALLAARPILTHMLRFSDLAAEFDGAPQFVGEELQRTWEAWDAYAADERRVR